METVQLRWRSQPVPSAVSLPLMNDTSSLVRPSLTSIRRPMVSWSLLVAVDQRLEALVYVATQLSDAPYTGIWSPTPGGRRWRADLQPRGQTGGLMGGG